MNNTKAYLHKLKTYTELREKHLETRERWFQSILVAAAGLLGALVALTNNSLERIEIRILFVLTIILIVLGILAAAIALFYNLVCASRAKAAARSLLICKNVQENEYFYISLDDPKKLLIFGALSYIFFSLSFISLIVYVILKNLPELFYPAGLSPCWVKPSLIHL